jgi:hypothetical protein
VTDILEQVRKAFDDGSEVQKNFMLRKAYDEIERLRLCAAPGRRTAHEYDRMGRPDGWTWLEHVQMWARLDQDHWDAIKSKL